MNDVDLLNTYAQDHSEATFQAIVERHANLVYSVALRRVGNAHLAEEVAQSVFIILSRKAGSISKGTILQGWLYRTTIFVSSRAIRNEIRRQQYEQKAAMMEPANSDETWERIAPHLDDALASLNNADRNALILRFFDDLTFKEIGASLGITDDTAQKKVTRALGKLRTALTHRAGVMSAIGLTTALSAHSTISAPVNFSSSVTTAAMTNAGSSAMVLAHESLRSILINKLRIAGLSSTAFLLICTLTFILTKQPPTKLPAASNKSTSFSPLPPTTASLQSTSPRQQTSVSGNAIRTAVQGTFPSTGAAIVRPDALANIQVKLFGTPGLKYIAASIVDEIPRQKEGILPDMINVDAKTFISTLTISGPGYFGFEVYRDSLMYGRSSERQITNSVVVNLELSGRGINMSSRSIKE